ncbi:UvrD-helicase domain-containing protein [Pedobacter sp. HMF7647]|uniref:DNA 3'-5' helicase n=1 Tax=Hufsiella arboris TaxID=2695275 RepID=A0A7K1Y5P8_9SPHI|nr:ATP-dependent DNA helicase [Hufsiella arboris]MXV49902.1 UvrD-helicase domain-containing protein [Hufsiella arboris]
MQLLSKYNQNFQEALQRLNENQLKAVNQIEGPVLVIAGPGTGKTQILAARIGKILLDTDTQPHNILCLTYTDAGAVAMRKRLFDFIGPEAHRVNIYTFHAFCNDIIQENLDYFGKLDLDPISDLERIDVFRTLVDSFSPNHPLKRFRGDVYFEIRRLQELFSTMKREDWSPEYISAKIDEFKDLVEVCEPDSPYYKDYKYTRKYLDKPAGSLKPAYTTFCENLEKLRAAVNEFPAYQKLMLDAGRYDYDDMILWVLNAFKNDENLLLNYQEKYQYVLVDEYQDTSGSQNELINLLISYWEKPNIFVVGDDDQSIFRFQGANVQNIEAYNSKYSADLYRIMLTDNYRSAQEILDISRELIGHNMERVNLPGLSKHLLAKNDRYLGAKYHPQLRSYQSQFHEFAAVTHEVGRLIQGGIAPEEIAVIYKEHRSGQELGKYFQLKGIPVHTKRKVNILTEPFGQKLINILRYIAAENEFAFSGDELLFEIMHYDFYEIAPIDIAKISVEVSEYNRSHRDKVSIRSKIQEIAFKTGQTLFDSESRKSIKRLSDDLEYWIKESHNLTLQNLFEKIMVRGGILAYILRSSEKTWYMQVLASLFNFLKDESRKDPSLNLHEFVLRLDLLKENDLSLDLNQTIFNQQGVNFLTCHGSKGLEFEYVFFIGCNKKVWEGKRKMSSGYKFPDTIFSSLPNSSDEEELRRLFYVAITRAKKHLYISYPEYDNKGKDLEPTVFIGEILSKTDLTVQRQEVSDDVLTDFFILQFTEQDKPDLGLIDKDYVDQLLEKYVLSVTHLNNYLDCPLKFYFQNLIQVPCGKNETMTFGSAVHWALNKLFRSLPDNGNEFGSIEQLLNDFYWYMNRNREAFTSEQFKRRMDYGNKILPEYYNKYINTWEKVTVTEYPIKNVEVQGIPIKGMIDKLEFHGNQVNVVDYKTGSFEKAKPKFKRPDEKTPLGGDYWRQAIFYKILVDNDRRKDWQVVSSEFDFIEPDKDEYVKEKVIIRPEDILVVTEQIIDTYSRIKNHEFTGCGKEDCTWCQFVRSNFQKPQDILEQAGSEEAEEL